jgi:GNAT superfamily N-acetyltransferase
MNDAVSGDSAYPQWYLACLEDGQIVGGLGVIENDFHNRPDLAPNVCAVFTEPDFRGQGIAGALLNFVYEDMKALGVSPIYLLTDHDSFYERYGWEFYCEAMGDGEDQPSRMYIKR